MATKKATTKRRAAKKVAKKKSASNREILETAGVINHGYKFSPQDSEAMEALSGEEVNVLIDVYNELGEEFFERNSPHGIVF